MRFKKFRQDGAKGTRSTCYRDQSARKVAGEDTTNVAHIRKKMSVMCPVRLLGGRSRKLACVGGLWGVASSVMWTGSFSRPANFSNMCIFECLLSHNL